MPFRYCRFWLHKAALVIRLHEPHDFLNRFAVGIGFGNFRDTFGQRPFALEDFRNGKTQVVDRLRRKSAAFQSDDVDAFQISERNQRKRNDVARDAAHAADHRVRSDARKLMHRGQSADDDVVADLDVSRQRRVVRHDHVAADVAVVRDVRADHEQPVVADDRDVSAVGRSRLHRRVFADRIVFADDQLALFILVLQVLVFAADRRERTDFRVFADRRVAADPDVGHQLHAVFQFDLRTDDAVRTDFDAVADFRAVFNDSR